MKLIKLFFLLNLLVIGCSSNKTLNGEKVNKKLDEKSLKNNCVNKKDSLSCAKLAYYYEGKGEGTLAYRFYKIGCRLKDKSACFNMKSANPKSIYLKKIESIMNFRTKNISNCYSKTSKQILVNSSMQLKEKWNRVNIEFHIDQNGNADWVSLLTDLTSDFKKCAISEIKKIQFPMPRGIDPTYTLNLTIQAQE